MANVKYWEAETPKVFRAGVNEFRYYELAQKLQVYPIVANTPNGVGRGTTIDLAAMDAEERTSFIGFMGMVLQSEDWTVSA